MFKATRLLTPLFIATSLLSACYYPPPPPQVRWVETPVGRAVQVGGAVREPKVVSRVNPAPTNSAGTVQARLVIAENGSVRSVQILSATDDDAANSAKEALARWKFVPTFVDSAPVPVVYELKLTFKAPS